MGKSRGRLSPMPIICVCSGVIAAGAAQAQTTAPPAARAANGPVVAENADIVVVAQKREQNLRDVPIAITALSGEGLEARGITNAEQLSSYTPNLTLIPQASGNTTFAISMRGITQTDSVITADSPVAVYIDGVVAPKLAGGIFDFVDLERIEVLRGPQGTLYGRNTPAGAINIITRKPSGKAGGYVTLGFGNYSQRELRFGIDLPALNLGGLGTLALRVSGRYLDRDGWVRDVQTGRRADSRHRYGGRAALRWQPGPDVTIDYTYDQSHIRETPPANQLHQDFSGLLGGYVTDSREKRLAFGYKDDPAAFADGTKTELNIRTHALTAEWRASEALTLRSITAYRRLFDNEPTDFDGTPLAVADFGRINRLKTFTQEVQGVASLFDHQLSLVTGLFYYNERGFSHATGVFGLGAFKQDTFFKTHTRAYAAYGQAEYTPDFLDRRLTLGVGLRYTSERRSLGDALVLFNDTIPLASLDKASKRFSKLSPTAFVSYKVLDDVNLYFRYAQGWRSGGFNGTSSTSAQLATPFADETVDSYEAGVKGSFLDRRLTVNVAGFISDYRDLQTVVVQPSLGGVGFQTINTNIGKIRISGLELEASVRPIRALSINGSYAYLHNDVKDYTLCLPIGQPGCTFQNLGNRRVAPLTPKHNWTIGGEATLFDNEVGRLTARVDASWRGNSIGGGQVIPSRPLSTDRSFIPHYTLVDARLTYGGLRFGGGTFEVTAWAKNLFDEKKSQFSLDLSDSLGIVTRRYLTPRTYGVDVTFRF